ncbi:hypothetical protein [Pedobacter sp. GR22-6]|uniref:hypothetical protein n=1 Tax=Pedobacter sp. GR22-6 TaxID=3127957 RepID=UPI00307F36B1
MKKSSTLICLLLFAVIAKAQEITKQEQGYFNLTELGFFTGQQVQKLEPQFGEAVYRTNKYAFSLRNINGWFVSKQFSIGAGVGLDGYHNPKNTFDYNNTFLLFADARYYFKYAASTFFAYGDLGSSIAIDSDFEKGLMFNLGLGYKLKLARRTGFVTSLGYNQQEINGYPSIRTNRISTFALKAGLLF